MIDSGFRRVEGRFDGSRAGVDKDDDSLTVRED
jgi:hypothetical protein